MRELLQKYALKAINGIDRRNDQLRDLFVKKISGLADKKDGDTEKGYDNNLRAYLFHRAKLESMPGYVETEGDAGSNSDSSSAITKQNNEKLIQLFVNAILTEVQVVLARLLNPNSASIFLENDRKELNEFIERIIKNEFAKLGALQTISYSTPDTQHEITNWKNILENYILGGKTLLPGGPDNVLMTPLGRGARLASTMGAHYYGDKSSFAQIAGSVSTNIGYVFFAAMGLYVIQLPLLYLFRRFVKKDPKAKLEKDELLFGGLGCLIAGLVGGATFITLATVASGLIIGVFVTALIAHTINLIMSVKHAKKMGIELELSAARIRARQQIILDLKEQRNELYASNFPKEKIKEEKEEIEKINLLICAETKKLEALLETHNQVRIKHETANNKVRMGYNIAAVVVAALVITFFILSAPFCPPVLLIPAVIALVVLGVIGAGLEIGKTVSRYRNEKRSRRAHAVEVEISEKITLSNEVENRPQAVAATSNLANNNNATVEKDKQNMFASDGEDAKAETVHLLSDKARDEKENDFETRVTQVDTVTRAKRVTREDRVIRVKLDPVTSENPSSIGLFSAESAQGRKEATKVAELKQRLEYRPEVRSRAASRVGV